MAVLKELVFIVVGALVVASLLRAFVGQMFIIPSGSMENTLLKGDRVVVEKITNVHRGDVVVFQDPAGWLDEPTADAGPVDRVLEFVGFPTASSPKHLIKRVIGMPGDTVVCCDDFFRLKVNGTALDETAYLYTDPSGGQVAASDFRFRVVVPAGRIFVMGDHRDDSADSRCHLADLSPQGQGQTAFVPITDVVGPAIAIAGPLDRTRRLRTPTAFNDVPPPTSAAPPRGEIEPVGVTCP